MEAARSAARRSASRARTTRSSCIFSSPFDRPGAGFAKHEAKTALLKRFAPAKIVHEGRSPLGRAGNVRSFELIGEREERLVRALVYVTATKWRTYVVTMLTGENPSKRTLSQARTDPRHRELQQAAQDLASRRWRRARGTSLEAVTALLDRHRGLLALAARETDRVLKLWSQTIAAPVLASFLFILVFGLSLGGRIRQIDGVDYDVFIVPGLIAMAMAQAAYSNNSSSVFQSRADRYINDVLSAPMRSWEVNLGLSIGGIVRALAIGGALFVLALAVTDVPVRHPLVLVLAVAILLVLFAALGVVVGVYAETWDQAGFVNNIVILPLSFLGGVFYSVDLLPSPWNEVSHVNPIFFLINAVRYGFLGTSDVPIGLALGVTAALAAACVAWSVAMFRSGRRLKA